jgi:hypothetical protein
MINPYLAAELRRAKRTFQKQARFNLAEACHITLGAMADARVPNEAEQEADFLIGLAFGDPIHA